MPKLGLLLAIVMLDVVLVTPNIADDVDDVDLYIKDLKAEDSMVRSLAAYELGKINNIRAVEPLIQSLNDSDRDVRWMSADALGEINDTRAVGPLIQALKDSDGNVRQSAAWALGNLKDPRAVDPLIQALSDKEYYVRKEAAYALATIEDPRATKALKDFGWIEINQTDIMAQKSQNTEPQKSRQMINLGPDLVVANVTGLGVCVPLLVNSGRMVSGILGQPGFFVPETGITTVSIKFTIKNIGNRPVNESLSSQVYACNRSKNIIFGPLNPGESYQGNASIKCPGFLGSCNLIDVIPGGVMVDVNDNMLELNETNNRQITQFPIAPS